LRFPSDLRFSWIVRLLQRVHRFFSSLFPVSFSLRQFMHTAALFTPFVRETTIYSALYTPPDGRGSQLVPFPFFQKTRCKVATTCFRDFFLLPYTPMHYQRCLNFFPGRCCLSVSFSMTGFLNPTFLVNTPTPSSVFRGITVCVSCYG